MINPSYLFNLLPSRPLNAPTARMSGIQIHTEDPISASSITPQTSNAGNPSQPAKSTAPPPYVYPPAEPGAVAPTPTRTVPHSSSYGPPAPQPGAGSVPPPRITAQLSLPPPPKAGEKPLSPEHYAPVPSTLAQPQPYPSQMSQPTVDSPIKGVPTGSTTATIMQPSCDPSTQPSNDASSTDMPIRASLEHPPGYVQDPFASDMTPDQRFAAEQQQGNGSDTLPSLGYTDNPRGTKPGLEDDIWGTAKKWMKESGKQAKEAWDKFGPEK